MEAFSFFLADVDANYELNATDASNILIFAAEQGAGIVPDWDKITQVVDDRIVDVKSDFDIHPEEKIS